MTNFSHRMYLFLTFVHFISQNGWGQGLIKSLGVWPLSLLRGPLSMDLVEAAPAFVCCSELGRSAFRGTDLLYRIDDASLLVHCKEVVPISESPLRKVPLCRERRERETKL